MGYCHEDSCDIGAYCLCSVENFVMRILLRGYWYEDLV